MRCRALRAPGSGWGGALRTNGRIVYVSGPPFGATKLSLRTVTSSTGGGSVSGPLGTGLTDQHRHPTWSPDRTKIAFAEGPGGATGYDIYILDLTAPGSTPQDITNSSGVTDDRPAWSPDGTRIAYESGNDIIVHPLNGGSDLNLTSTLTPKAWKAAWSPDSQTLYYSVGDITQNPNGNNNDIRLYQQPADNSAAGTAAHPHQRRACVPTVDLARRNEALLYGQYCRGKQHQRQCCSGAAELA